MESRQSLLSVSFGPTILGNLTESIEINKYQLRFRFGTFELTPKLTKLTSAKLSIEHGLAGLP